MWIEAAIIGGTLAASVRTYRQRSKRQQSLRLRITQPASAQVLPKTLTALVRSSELQTANRTLMLSSISLGLTTVGLLAAPPLRLLSVPILLYLFAPIFHAAYGSLRQERRITDAVLCATRMSISLLLGYYVAAALDAWLQSLSRKLITQADTDFNHTLSDLTNKSGRSVWVFRNGVAIETAFEEVMVGDIIAVDAGETIAVDGVILSGDAWIDESTITGDAQPTFKSVEEQVFSSTIIRAGLIYVQVEVAPERLDADEIRAVLQRTIESKTSFQALGEAGSTHLMPRALLLSLFAIATPLWGPYRATTFLAVSFGAQMKTLGPFTLQNTVTLAARQGILIKDVRALERSNLVNTVVFDAHILADPLVYAQAKETILALRQRKWVMTKLSPHEFAIYCIVDNRKVIAELPLAELGLDDILTVTSAAEKATRIEFLQMSERHICYVSDGLDDIMAVEKAWISVSLCNSTTIAADATQILLMNKNLRQLNCLFDIADQYSAKQGFNVLWPSALDVLSIGTAAFLHFGLTAALLFHYSGLLMCAMNARLPLMRYKMSQTATTAENLLPETLSSSQDE